MSAPPTPLSSLPLGVNVAPAVDAMFLGIMLSVLLWGITLSQTLTYFNINKDGWMLRALVGILFLMDSVSSIMLIVMARIYLLENFGNLEILTTLPWPGICEVALNVAIVFIVELFFARRLYLLNQRRTLVPGLIVLFSLAGLVCGILLVINVSKTPTVAGLAKPSMKVETALCNTFEAVADLIAALGMSYEFYRNKSHIKSTNSILDRLLGYTVARGGLMTVAQFLTLALYVAQPTKLNWMPVHFSLSKLCHITMMVILNGRESLRRDGGSTNETHVFTETIVSTRPGGVPNEYQLKSLPGDGIASIRVHQERVTEYDDGYLSSKA